MKCPSVKDCRQDTYILLFAGALAWWLGRRIPEREVGGSILTRVSVLCLWARHIYLPKVLVIPWKLVAPCQHDWKIVYRDVKNQVNQLYLRLRSFSVPQLLSNVSCICTPWCIYSHPNPSESVLSISRNTDTTTLKYQIWAPKCEKTGLRGFRQGST